MSMEPHPCRQLTTSACWRTRWRLCGSRLTLRFITFQMGMAAHDCAWYILSRGRFRSTGISANLVLLVIMQVMMRQYQGTTSNELLDYLKCLDTKALGQLTACAGEDIMEAMNAFIHRLLGSSDDEELRRIPSQSNAVELARLLFWYELQGLRTCDCISQTFCGDAGALKKISSAFSVWQVSLCTV